MDTLTKIHQKINDIQDILTDTRATLDAFGRKRASQPETLFDSKQLFDNAPLFWDDQEISGASTTSVHSRDTASTIMGVADATAGKRIRQTFRRFNYQPGKSQLILMTGTLVKSGGGTGITSRIGLYDDNNGIFFQSNNGVLQIGLRSSTSGAPVDTIVNQDYWSVNPLDRDNKKTLDVTNSFIFFIDFEWLGVGTVRTGFIIDGEYYITHEFFNANRSSGVYMSTPNLPLRYEIENDGTGVASTLEHICSTVISEGGSQEIGTVFYKSTEGVHLDAVTENTLYAVMGIRLNPSNLGATVKLLDTQLQLQTATDKAEWILLWNPTVAGTFNYNSITNSSVEYAIGVTANTVTGGTHMSGGFFESTSNGNGGAGSTGSALKNALLLGGAIDGTPDEIVLCVRPVDGSSNIDVEGAITWRELT